MDEKLIEKMLGQALKQYGRNVATDPLSPGEKKILKLALQERRIEEPNEDVIYDYVTNQGLFSS